MADPRNASILDTPEFRKMWDDGFFAAKIGAHFGCSEGTVSRLARRYGYKARHKKVGLRNTKRFRSMWDSGMPVMEIAEALGLVGASSVYDAAIRFGYPEIKRRRKVPVAKKVVIRALPALVGRTPVVAKPHGQPRVMCQRSLPSAPPVAADNLLDRLGVERVEALKKSKGSYETLKKLADAWGKPMRTMQLYWHRVRAL